MQPSDQKRCNHSSYNDIEHLHSLKLVYSRRPGLQNKLVHFSEPPLTDMTTIFSS